ncbi:MAG TPA: pantoate--beta-alanine ligase [Gemmatimonadaceae bacterium]|jgi:pantoate--beta-alanine ligase
MKTETTLVGIRARVAELRGDGARIALVPTMGALHEGHLALVDAAKKVADSVIVSIFVNPLQFGPSEDFARYPRTLDADATRLRAHGASVLFAPEVTEMYPDGSRTRVEPPPFAGMFEGTVRPGHFSGVLTVVAKLFNLVSPDLAFFGRKDLQQLAVIRTMVTDLNVPIEIVAIDTIRERDGLALSSRNRYLDDQGRRRATRIRAALLAAKTAFDGGVTDPSALEHAGGEVLAEDGALDVDYFNVVREIDFARPVVVSAGDSIVTAVRVGGTRLIDNIIL